MTCSTNQTTIDELLDNAYANGYDQTQVSAIDVAYDLVRYSADVEQESPEGLVPFIEDWQQRRLRAKSGRT